MRLRAVAGKVSGLTAVEAAAVGAAFHPRLRAVAGKVAFVAAVEAFLVGNVGNAASGGALGVCWLGAVAGQMALTPTVVALLIGVVTRRTGRALRASTTATLRAMTATSAGGSSSL